MTSLTSIINVNVPTEVKEEATILFNDLGINMTTAINMLLKKSISEWAIPFEVSAKKPNHNLRKALKEGENILTNKIDSQGYHDVDKMFEDILNEDRN